MEDVILSKEQFIKQSIRNMNFNCSDLSREASECAISALVLSDTSSRKVTVMNLPLATIYRRLAYQLKISTDAARFRLIRFQNSMSGNIAETSAYQIFETHDIQSLPLGVFLTRLSRWIGSEYQESLNDLEGLKNLKVKNAFNTLNIETTQIAYDTVITVLCNMISNSGDVQDFDLRKQAGRLATTCYREEAENHIRTLRRHMFKQLPSKSMKEIFRKRTRFIWTTSIDSFMNMLARYIARTTT